MQGRIWQGVSLVIALALLAPAAASARTAKLSGTVWADSDHDGIRDAAEVGLKGVTVTVEKRGSKSRYSRVATLTTGSRGTWSRNVVSISTMDAGLVP